ncbi:hypothetical protein [Arcobacter roscoffensis]|uniref:Uncharacterized protein n=1 Tax=Arcobacter roscoffensis TaxID=2961520 RepID=A0ABY5E615_9BACT|nr:hypothetical protein [Arcobacter roscoffensis]UTJ07592.1 hypothetical protein NJU99_05720 [Arcobacter roscoffensis]
MILKILSFILLFTTSLFACASGWSFHDKQFVFLEQRELPFSNNSGNLKDSAIYNQIHWDYEKRNKQANLKEWQNQFKNSLTLEQIEKIVYKRESLNLIKNQEVLDYLNLVEKQESLVVPHYYYYKKKKEKLDPQVLINQALKKIDEVDSEYLKLRYFYLALRLTHYKNMNALEVFENYKYLLDSKSKTIVKDWIEALYAGILIKDKQIALGVYNFTKLFDKSKINWQLSFYNFYHINTNELWEELKSLAKSEEEKEKFITLRALNANANTLIELQNLYELNPNSKWFDFLLYRQLLNTQHFFDEHTLYERDFQIKEYINFLESISKDDMYLIDLSLSYFYLYDGNIKKAQEFSEKLLKTNSNHETRTLNYLIYLNSLKKVNLEDENIIYKKMSQLLKEHEGKCLNTDSIHNYTFKKLEKLYKAQNDELKMILSASVNYLRPTIFDLKSLEEFKAFINKKPQTKLEEYFIKQHKKRAYILEEKESFVLSKNLKDTNTKLLINNLQFRKALNINANILNEKIRFNPFNVNIKGNNREGKQYTYTTKQFLEKTLEIKKQIDLNPKSVMDNYLYANALYNLSYFGNSNSLTTVYRSVYSFKEKNLEEKKINLSIKHYKKALKYAKNKEFRAKIVYMLAKSELASFDIKFSKKREPYYIAAKESYEPERFWVYSKSKIYKKYLENGYGEFFEKLDKEYSNTKYYEELIKECANLRIYKKEIR